MDYWDYCAASGIAIWAGSSSPTRPNLPHYVKDLHQSGLLRRPACSSHCGRPLASDSSRLGWAADGNVDGVLSGLLWGGLARVFLVHHVTWSINSICHLWGRQPYPTGDHSRNNFVFGPSGSEKVGITTIMPSQRRHGSAYGGGKSTWAIGSFVVLAWLGLASRVKTPC